MRNIKKQKHLKQTTALAAVKKKKEQNPRWINLVQLKAETKDREIEREKQ